MYSLSVHLRNFNSYSSQSKDLFFFTGEIDSKLSPLKTVQLNTQVNRMCRSRRVLATGGKQRIFWLDMVCIETILFHLDSF